MIYQIHYITESWGKKGMGIIPTPCFCLKKNIFLPTLVPGMRLKLLDFQKIDLLNPYTIEDILVKEGVEFPSVYIRERPVSDNNPAAMRRMSDVRQLLLDEGWELCTKSCTILEQEL